MHNANKAAIRRAAEDLIVGAVENEHKRWREVRPYVRVFNDIFCAKPRHQVEVEEFLQCSFLFFSFRATLPMTTMSRRLFCLVLPCLLLHVDSFAPLSVNHAQRRSSLSMSFFKDLVNSAFQNDGSLSTDKSKGQYDGPYDEESQYNAPTQTQERWRTSVAAAQGSNVNQQLLENTRWQLSLFLSGVANKDPSNDLYGSKVNISSRDQRTGLNLPDEPSVIVEMELLPEGVCKTKESSFTTGKVDGQWKLSDDGSMIRFSMDVVGYSRTVQTRGSITKVYWSREDEKTTETSSTYQIPGGILYADASLASTSSKPGVVDMKDGVLRLEKTMGLLGAASKLVPCGGFEAKRIHENQ